MLLQGGETLNVPKDSKASDSQHRIGGFPKPGVHHVPGYLHNHYGRNPQNLEGKALPAVNIFGENRRLISDPTWLSRLQHHQAMRVEPPRNIKGHGRSDGHFPLSTSEKNEVFFGNYNAIRLYQQCLLPPRSKHF